MADQTETRPGSPAEGGPVHVPELTAEHEPVTGVLAPPTEEVHMPEPSYLPVVLAFGVTLAIVGVVVTPVLCIIGGVIGLIALVRWIRLTRAEMAELPLEHH